MRHFNVKKIRIGAKEKCINYIFKSTLEARWTANGLNETFDNEIDSPKPQQLPRKKTLEEMRREYHAMMDLTSPAFALKSPAPTSPPDLPTIFDDEINPVFIEESEQETDKSTENRVRFANI